MNTRQTAIIINSPFQAICALEYIKERNINDVVVYTIEDVQNTKKIQSLLADYGYCVTVIPQSKNMYKWYIDNRNRDKYNTIIVGDLFSFPLLILSSIMTKRTSKVIYVDDGNSTLMIDAGILPQNFFSFKWRFVSVFLNLKCSRRYLYTIFPINNYKGMSIIHHSFNFIIRKINDSKITKGVYIIGTNTSALDINTDKYRMILKAIKDELSDDNVYYCPHRRDLNNYNDYCKSIGIGMFDTNVSVEYDFIKNKIYPSKVLGFGSTALYTLKKLFPLADIYNINLELNDDRLIKCYKYISEFYQKEGIDSVDGNINQ